MATSSSSSSSDACEALGRQLSYAPLKGQTTQNGCERTQTRTMRAKGSSSGTGEAKEERERERKSSGQRLEVKAARGQHERICRALRFQVSSVTLECSLWNTTSAETKLQLRAMDLLRERKTVNVSWWGRP